ncbi:hypothetical protein KEM54_006481 [Ascosphaera aggregata]|nr:hypothetical protein KEM54_006481 [Ascosphaera aggregata]
MTAAATSSAYDHTTSSHIRARTKSSASNPGKPAAPMSPVGQQQQHAFATKSSKQSQIAPEVPRVDYLLRHGGLPYRVPRDFLGGAKDCYDAKRNRVVLFDKYARLLDDYGYVLKKQGSLAVATGYRSIARRLLDRLESVFARDISSEECTCLMCSNHTGYSELPEEVSWGEVLELVSGRRDLPEWPPFNPDAQLKTSVIDNSGIINNEPMQKVDEDIPVNWREHYLKESRKKKAAVDKWLHNNASKIGDAPLPEEDLDDETMVFVMGTYLSGIERTILHALLNVPNEQSDAPRKGSTPPPRTRPAYLVKANTALKRLYRLASPPRDPEAAYYMLKNPSMHNILATLAAISNDEWDILVSGRFDGFLRSGAEDEPPILPPSTQASTITNGGRTSRAGSSNSFRPASRTSRDGSAVNPSAVGPGVGGVGNGIGSGGGVVGSVGGGPILVDEETEIAVLQEMEESIFLGMEALEDAFEALNNKAEAVRRAIQDRSTGLVYANQIRKAAAEPEVKSSGRPEPDSDDGFDDNMSELAPWDICI